MATYKLRRLSWVCAPLLGLAVALLSSSAAFGRANDKDDTKLPAALSKPMPESIQDLLSIQLHVKNLVAKVMPAVVNVKPQNGGGQGSGVVISEDGLILTAAHVSGEPNRVFLITFPDGKQVKGKSLGAYRTGDDGLLKITEEGKYPFCEMGKSSELKKSQWVIAIGHPGGLKPGRTPPVRLGRVISTPGTWVTTECTLVGGDSGGPLFDMTGKVVGIHSRIGNPLTSNMHVPVDIFRTDWDRMVKGEIWGNATGGGKGPPGAKAGPPARLGVAADVDFTGKGIKVGMVVPGCPAEKAGLKAGDIITAINAKTIATADELRAEIGRRKVGDEVTLDLRRGTEIVKLKVVLDKAVQ